MVTIPEYLTALIEGLGEAGALSIILIVLMLAAILESFRQPALILVTLPLALIGAFWALALAGESISLFVIMITLQQTTGGHFTPLFFLFAASLFR